jgi:DNA processing protein
MSVLPPERGRQLLLLVITSLPGIGPARTNAIIGRHGADPSLLDAGPELFSDVPGIGANLAASIVSSLGDRSWRKKAIESANDQLERADRLGATVLTILDDRYPPLLREIYDPPPLLFVRGDPDNLSLPSIAVVGTRRASDYGKEAAGFICRELALAGYAIVSGLAYGIDMAAHRAALESGTKTVAVLGCGIDNIYTDRAGKLWPSIAEHGAIVSEEWIGQEPAPENFPKRNRIISGLSAGTLIVESDIRGGSMITASTALEQNREVFAVPGGIFSRNSRGTNSLIQRCQAKPVHSAGDILAELPPLPSPAVLPDTPGVPVTLPLDDEESRIVSSLSEGALHIDRIAEVAGLTISNLLVRLFELELRRIVIQEPGQFFRLRQMPER